jgi:endonuclease/exonuclease/phosphatase family metal-dependent hydrolase
MEVDMKKQKHRLICWQAFLVVAVLALFGCTGKGEKYVEIQPITLMTWNVHNLFDGKDDGYEYPEFLLSAGWSQEKYMGRINTISAAISTIERLPDIIILQEIESLQILEDLALALPRGYLYSYFANNPGGIGLGFLSRFPLLDAKAHSITVGGITAPRPVLEVRVQTGQGEFIVMACHWKSKLGGVEITEHNRRASARVILRRIREIWENEPEMGIIVAGDLNVNYDEFYRRGSDVICSLLPDDPSCVELAGADQKDFIVITGTQPPLPVYFPDTINDEEVIVLYSPWMGEELQNGSYLFRGSWETIDHFLVSGQFFYNSGWEYAGSSIMNFEPFTNSDGVPVPYNPRTGFGLSDHLPLLLFLRYSN